MGVERRAPYTSAAQFMGNLLYIPVLLDTYGWLFEGSPALYVLFFPLDVWLLEVVLHYAIVFIWGHNVAWCYKDYADEFLDGAVRVGHGAAWWVLGVFCL